MDMLKRLFPFSFKACSLKEFLIALVIYIVLDFVCGLVIGILGKFPLIGGLFELVGSILGIYVVVGMILAILVFLNVIR